MFDGDAEKNRWRTEREGGIDMKFDILKAFEHVGIEEGDIFIIGGDIFTIGADTINYRITDNEFQHHRVGAWTGVHVDFEDLVHKDIVIVEKAPWKPKMGERYYVEVAHLGQGWDSIVWVDHPCDKRYHKRLPLFKTEEEVIEHIRAKGWVE